MSGRGRGINNAPAWMTQNNAVLGNGGAPVENINRPPQGLPPLNMNEEYDAFGRAPRHPQPHGDPDRRRGSYNDEARWEGRGNSGPGRRRGGGRDRDRDRDRHKDDRDNRGGRSNNNINTSSSREQLGLIVFRSYDEEQDWIDERRRKRKSRPAKFDVPPTPQQLAADAAVKTVSNPGATDFAGIPKSRDFIAVPQQTRHARRLYIGHLPPNVNEQELHDFFRTSIYQALTSEKLVDDDDPILSVYINHERRFCFLEFREVAMATACMALDGINVNGKGKVKVKRPNDYNPTMAPTVHPSTVPVLDVSKLGIISTNVQDGPNKVFIGGLHYHLTDTQVLELLSAFGKIKAFHLVRNEPDSPTSKGYCFVEYADSNSTPVAVMGLNGMDMGGGKILTARIAGQRGQPTPIIPNVSVGISGQNSPPKPPNSINATIVSGYDIEALVDAAMGLKTMPTVPTHVDKFGVPITQISSAAPASVTATTLPPLPPQQSRLPPGPPTSSTMEFAPVPQTQIPPSATSLPLGSSALEIANAAQAALDAAFGSGGTVQSNVPPPPPPQQTKSRILVLLNIVSNEDLSTDEEYNGLIDEIEEEVRKFGKLLSMQIPRTPSATIEASAIGKIFLEYATIQDSANAEQELAGRQFGPNAVEANYYNEHEYALLKLR